MIRALSIALLLGLAMKSRSLREDHPSGNLNSFGKTPMQGGKRDFGFRLPDFG